MKHSLLSKLSMAKIRSIASNQDFTGMIAVKGGQRPVGWFLRVIRVGVGAMSLSWVKVAKAYGSFLYRLWSKQGTSGVVKYLKAASVLLQQSIGGHKLCDPGQLGPRVSRTSSGLPRVIPTIHRHRIRSGDLGVIRTWLTLLSLYRVLEFPGKLKLSTITDPGRDISKLLLEATAFMPAFLRELQKFSAQTVTARMSAVRMNPLSADINQLAEVLALYLLPAEPFHIRKSSPLSSEISKVRGLDTKVETYASTSLTGLVESAYAVRHSAIWSALCSYAKWTNNGWVVDRILELSSLAVGNSGVIGKLGTKEEPAGKIRVFAMVDPWTQWLLQPLHRWLFELLSKVPQDGTFDQMRPVNQLWEKDSIKRFWSYDLSAATDRLPVSLQTKILTAMFGSKIAENWEMILVGRQYKTPKGADVKFVKYAVGQPMGALSSWAMLALSHHFIVQWAAFRVHQRDNPGKFFKWFPDYAVLGDDIVIARGRVAREYLNLMESLGVGIGLAKSLVARNRTLEFAKRFWTPYGDASPISFKELVVAVGSLTVFHEFCKKFSVSHSMALSVMGWGYKVKGRMSASFDSMTGRLSTTLLVLEMGKYTFVEWVRLVAIGKFRDSGEYPLSRFWLAVNQALLARYRQVLSDRLRSLGKALTRMAKLSSLDLKSDSNFEDVEYELREGSLSKARAQVDSSKGIKRLSVGNPASVPEIDWPFKAGYLRKLLAEAVIRGSAIWVDVSQKVDYLSEAEARRMDPALLKTELDALGDRLSSISDLSVLEIRKGEKVERDQVINDVRVWYSVRNTMRRPEPQALVSQEPAKKVLRGEIVLKGDDGWKRVLWGFRLALLFCVCVLFYTIGQLTGLIPISGDQLINDAEEAPRRAVSLTESLGWEVQEAAPGLWDPDPLVRSAEVILARGLETGSESYWDLGYASGVIFGTIIKGVLIAACLWYSWVILKYGLLKIGYAIYYFGMDHPNATGQSTSTSVGQGIERLTVPQAPSIATGPFTPNTLEQVRSDLAYQAWMDNLDLSPISALWEIGGMG